MHMWSRDSIEPGGPSAAFEMDKRYEPSMVLMFDGEPMNGV